MGSGVLQQTALYDAANIHNAGGQEVWGRRGTMRRRGMKQNHQACQQALLKRKFCSCYNSDFFPRALTINSVSSLLSLWQQS